MTQDLESGCLGPRGIGGGGGGGGGSRLDTTAPSW